MTEKGLGVDVEMKIVPLLGESDGYPTQAEKSGQIKLGDDGRLVNPVETLEGRKDDVLWFTGPNYTEESVQLIVGERLGIVNLLREDAKNREAGAENSISGGFVDLSEGEVWGSGQTTIREMFEELKVRVNPNQLIDLGGWYCHDPRSSQHRWIETKAFLAPVLRGDVISLNPEHDEVAKAEIRSLDSEFLDGNFYADHKKSVLIAIRTLQDRTRLIVDKDGYLRLPIDEKLAENAKINFEVSAQDIANRFSSYWVNTGPNQLRRIWSRTNHDLDALGVEVANRELLSDRLIRSVNPITEFLGNFDKYSVLFESMADGDGFVFTRFIRSNFPLLGLYPRSSDNPLATQDYRGNEELPVLLSKGLVRVSENINAISTGNIMEFSGKVDEERFGKIGEMWGTLEKSGLSPVFIAAALHLDVAKGGSLTEKKYWSETGINAFVHNEASAELVRRGGVLEKVMGEFDFRHLDDNERESVVGLFEKIIAYHGYIGQWVRGEVTEHVMEGFTKWVSENEDTLKSALGKLGVTESLSGLISSTYYLVNVIDTASVRDGLYTDKLDDQFINFKLQLKSVLEGTSSWGDVLKQRLEAVSERSEKKSELLADRLTRLRGGKDYEEVLGTLLELGQDKIDYIFVLLEHSQLWYVENATANFSAENQLKLLVLISRMAREKGTDKFGNFDVNFAPLMNTLRPDGKPNKALTRIIDTALYGLSWDEVTSTPNKNNIPIPHQHLEIKLTGENGIMGIDCLLDEDMAEACSLINAYYAGKRDNSDDYKKAAEALNKWTGIKLDEWDRVFDQELYVITMNATMSQKVESMLPIIEEAKRNGKKVVVIGIGSGSGELEHALVITDKLGKEDMVIGTDISRAMVENMKRISRIISANRYLNPGVEMATMKAAQVEASQINRESIGVTEDADTVVVYSIYSVAHEFASYSKDNFRYGEVTTSIFGNIMSTNNLKIGDEIDIRDFIQADDPNEKVRLKIGNTTGSEVPPVAFIRKFTKEFKGFTDSEKAEIASFPQDLTEGSEIQVSKGLAMEIMGHYSWLKDGKNQKEWDERYGYFDADGFKTWFSKIAKKNGIKIEVEIQSQPAEYEKYIGGRMDIVGPDGNPLPVPLNMGTIRIKRVA